MLAGKTFAGLAIELAGKHRRKGCVIVQATLTGVVGGLWLGTLASIGVAIGLA